jgi:hypothetical protein
LFRPRHRHVLVGRPISERPSPTAAYQSSIGDFDILALAGHRIKTTNFPRQNETGNEAESFAQDGKNEVRPLSRRRDEDERAYRWLNEMLFNIV